jgi:hypothetical protein
LPRKEKKLRAALVAATIASVAFVNTAAPAQADDGLVLLTAADTRLHELVFATPYLDAPIYVRVLLPRWMGREYSAPTPHRHPFAGRLARKGEASGG